MTTDAAAADPRRRLARSAAGVFGAGVAALAIGYVSSVLLARYLGPSSRGLLAAMQAGAALLTVVLAAGVPAAANFLASRDPAVRPALLGNGLVHAGLLTVVVTALVWPFRDALTERFAPGYDPLLWLGAALLVPVTLLDFLLSSLLGSKLAFTARNRLVILGRVAGLVATLVLVVAADGDVAGALVAVAAAQLVMIAGGLRHLADEGLRVSRALVRPTLSYGVRVSLTALLNTVNARFDLLLLATLAPLSTVGHYAVAQLVAELVMLIPRSLGSVLLPTVAANRGRDALSAAALRLNGTLSLAGVVGVAVLGPLLILYGYGEAFRPAITPLLILLPGLYLLSAGELASEALRGRGRPGIVSILAGTEAAVSVALAVLLVPRHGAVGGAIASACAYAVFGVSSLVTVARQDGVPVRSLLATSPAETRRAVQGLARRLRRR